MSTKNDQEEELVKLSPVHEVVLQRVIEHLPSTPSTRLQNKRIWGGDMESAVGKSMKACDSKGQMAMVVTDVSVDLHMQEMLRQE